MSGSADGAVRRGRRGRELPGLRAARERHSPAHRPPSGSASHRAGAERHLGRLPVDSPTVRGRACRPDSSAAEPSRRASRVGSSAGPMAAPAAGIGWTPSAGCDSAGAGPAAGCRRAGRQPLARSLGARDGRTRPGLAPCAAGWRPVAARLGLALRRQLARDAAGSRLRLVLRRRSAAEPADPGGCTAVAVHADRGRRFTSPAITCREAAASPGCGAGRLAGDLTIRRLALGSLPVLAVRQPAVYGPPQTGSDRRPHSRWPAPGLAASGLASRSRRRTPGPARPPRRRPASAARAQPGRSTRRPAPDHRRPRLRSAGRSRLPRPTRLRRTGSPGGSVTRQAQSARSQLPTVVLACV